jgi:hypothetical protein
MKGRRMDRATMKRMLENEEKQHQYAERRRLITLPQLDRHLLIYYVEPPPRKDKTVND